MSGEEISKDNTEYPNRLLLIKHIKKDKFIVKDFGDFKKYNKDELLNVFSVNQKFIDVYSERLYEVITNINKWITVSGNEFIIDSKMFKVVSPYLSENQSHEV